MTTHSKSDKDSGPGKIAMPRDREDEWLRALEAALSDIKSLDDAPPLAPAQDETAPPASDFVTKPINRGRYDRRPIERLRSDDRLNVRSKSPPWRGAPAWPFNERQGRHGDGRLSSQDNAPPEPPTTVPFPLERTRYVSPAERAGDPNIDPNGSGHIAAERLAPVRPARPAQALSEETFPSPAGVERDAEQHQDIIEQLWRPEPIVLPKRRSTLAVITRFSLATAMAGAVGYLAVQFIDVGPQGPTEPTAQGKAASQVHLASTGDRPAPAISRPRLVVSPLAGMVNRPVALGVTVDSALPGGTVLVRGLPAGSSISAGQPGRAGEWQIPIGDLGRAVVQPPRDFIGTMNLSVDLARADGAVTDNQVQQLEWSDAAPEPVAPTPVKTTTVVMQTPQTSAVPEFAPPPVGTATVVARTPPSPPARQVTPAAPPEPAKPPVEQSGVQAFASAGTRHLEADEIDKLLKRGSEFLRDGDIAAARLLLRRAAEGGDARAAFALAATYDPVTLKELGLLGVQPEVEKARNWYRVAAERGSSEANARLMRLGNR